MTEANQMTIIMYPIVILITFSIIKLINIRLHLMFDGEEVNELEVNKDKDVEEGNVASMSTEEGGEGGKAEAIELDVLSNNKPIDSEGDEEKVDDGDEDRMAQTNFQSDAKAEDVDTQNSKSLLQLVKDASETAVSQSKQDEAFDVQVN